MKAIAIGTHRLPSHEASWRTPHEWLEAAMVLLLSAGLLVVGVRVVARVIVNTLKILLFTT